MSRVESITLLVCDECENWKDIDFDGKYLCGKCGREMIPAEFVRTPPEEYAPDYDKVLDDLRKKQAGGE